MYIRLKDIAEKAGVSVNAVSRALRNAPDIGEETTKKIQQLAEEMGYVRNDIHHYTFKRTSTIMGIAISSVTNPYFYVFLSKLIDALEGTDYCPLIIKSKDGKLSDENLKSFMSKRVGGIISLIDVGDGVAEKCTRYKIPLVMAGSKAATKKINGFYWKNGECGRLVAEEFLKSGRKNPCYVGYGLINFSGERYYGFKDCLGAQGVSCAFYDLYDKERPITLETFPQGFKNMARQIKDNKHDFIFCLNDEVAALLDKELLKCGYDDFVIYGVDGITKYMPSYGRINSVSIDYEKIAKEILERLFDLIRLEETDAYTFKSCICPLEIVKVQK